MTILLQRCWKVSRQFTYQKMPVCRSLFLSFASSPPYFLLKYIHFIISFSLMKDIFISRFLCAFSLSMKAITPLTPYSTSAVTLSSSSTDRCSFLAWMYLSIAISLLWRKSFHLVSFVSRFFYFLVYAFSILVLASACCSMPVLILLM